MLYNHDNGYWGSVCDEEWSNEDAKVVCRQLGLPYNAAQAIHGAFFGKGSGYKSLDDVECNGDESSLDQCHHSGWRDHSCGWNKDAGILCADGKLNCFRKIQ